MLSIIKATLEDVKPVKHIIDKKYFGFINSTILEESIKDNELFIAVKLDIIGFIRYHHRLDYQTTIYELLVKEENRLQGIGSSLIKNVEEEAIKYNKQFLQLKCPVGFEANNFYIKLGFIKVETVEGKDKDLNIYRKYMDNISLI